MSMTPHHRPAPGLRLAVGKYYQRADGTVHGPMRANCSLDYPFISTRDDHATSWTHDGKYFVCDPVERLDLIRECTKSGTPIPSTPQRRRGGKGKRPKGYEAWRSMMRRCYDCKAHNYHRYGARGITVCDEWHYFNNFQADMGLRPSPLHQLDRIDNNGNYTKMNCRWATPKENCRNRSNNTIIEHDGRKLCVAQWAEESGIAVMTLISRMERGWPFAKCLAIDPSKYHQRQKVCKNGHDDWRTNPSGGRYCHQCRMEYKRKWCKSRIRIPAPPESRGGK